MDPERAGAGSLAGLGVHLVDLLRFVTGDEVVEVYADGAVLETPWFARHGDVDTAAVVLTMADGLPVVVTGSRHDPRGHDFRLEVLASEDSVSVGLDEHTPLRPLEPSAPAFGTRPYDGFLDRFAAAFDAELRAWLEFVRGERPNPCPGIEALHALRVAVACDRSRAEGRPVALSEVSDDDA
jgi:myo-inositol 2-dehydrogenase/D-chiro-inositol 1-dehydrogenase